jgi:hypothetical protein
VSGREREKVKGLGENVELRKTPDHKEQSCYKPLGSAEYVPALQIAQAEEPAQWPSGSG